MLLQVKPFNMKWIFSLSALLLLTAACTNQGSSGSGQESEPVLTEQQKQAYLEKGQDISMATFSALSSQLASALRESGVEGAVEYCNLVAYPLVDSLSAVHDATIRRTSFKVRNPKDAPTAQERAVLEEYHAREAAGQSPEARVVKLNGKQIAYYAPIRIQPLCLQCHGKLGESLKEEDYAIIKELYPKDEAIGYENGDLRGMWSITFREE